MERTFDLYKIQGEKEFKEKILGNLDLKNYDKLLDNLKDKLYTILSDYFNLSDTYTYELTRVKTSPIIEADDFEEWGEENVESLVEHLILKMKEDNIIKAILEEIILGGMGNEDK